MVQTMMASSEPVGLMTLLKPGLCSSGCCNSTRRKDLLSELAEKQARELLDHHPHFRGRSKDVQCTCEQRCLYLIGTVPTFYLKQLAQEAVRSLRPAVRVENQIVVANPNGSVRPLEAPAPIRKPR